MPDDHDIALEGESERARERERVSIRGARSTYVSERRVEMVFVTRPQNLLLPAVEVKSGRIGKLVKKILTDGWGGDGEGSYNRVADGGIQIDAFVIDACACMHPKTLE